MLARMLKEFSLLTLVLILSGCASAYRANPRGCVPLEYHAQPPLPYQMYRTCEAPITADHSAAHGAEELPADELTPPNPHNSGRIVSPEN